MITRPLDLASRLRREPRSFDWIFYVNAGLIVVFFSLFGSKFVLAPALGVDFRLPTATGAVADARLPTSFISVTVSGRILAGDGLRSIDQLGAWLREKARGVEHPVLLVRADRGVSLSLSTEIAEIAGKAGFVGVVFAAVEPRPPEPARRP
jgi:biopolymer transport protein ExbD